VKEAFRKPKCDKCEEKPHRNTSPETRNRKRQQTVKYRKLYIPDKTHVQKTTSFTCASVQT